MTDKRITRIARELANPGDEHYPYALILAAAAVVGPNQRRIAKETGLDRDLIQKVAGRMRSNGIWVAGRVRMEDPNDAIEWNLNVLVALGHMEAVRA